MITPPEGTEAIIQLLCIENNLLPFLVYIRKIEKEHAISTLILSLFFFFFPLSFPHLQIKTS